MLGRSSFRSSLSGRPPATEKLELLAEVTSPTTRGSPRRRSSTGVDETQQHLTEAAAAARHQLSKWARLDSSDKKAILAGVDQKIGYAEGISSLLSLATLDLDGKK